MDVVSNYAAGEEAVGAFFSHENDKGKAPADDDEGPNRGSKKNKKMKKTLKALVWFWIIDETLSTNLYTKCV